MSTIVSHYGLHRTTEGVVYLHQGGDKNSNFIRLKESSPFQVQIQSSKVKACPHLFNVSALMPDKEHWQRFMEIFKDPVVQEFLPLPRHHQDSIPFIADIDDMLLVALSRLSSPISPTVMRFDQFRDSQHLFVTNVGPIVLTHLKPKDQAAMENLVTIVRRAPRKLILAGDNNMVISQPAMKRVETLLHLYPSVELHSLPMESLGAVSMRRWARGEQIDTPWER